MPIPEAPLDSIKYDGAVRALVQLPQALEKLNHSMRAGAVATLVAAIVSNMNRPVSLDEVAEIHKDVYFMMYGGELTGHGAYQAWAKEKETRLAKVHT